MIHYQDDHTIIEILGRVVVIMPRPLADLDRARQIQALFPISTGWTHYRYAVNRLAGQDVTQVAEDAAARLQAQK